MPEFYRKLFDLYEAYQTLEIKDLALPTFAGLWILTLLIQLTGINKRDIATAAAYIVYLMSSAIILLFILPSQYIQLDLTVKSQILTLLALGIVAALRWWFRDDLLVRKDELYNAPIPEEVSE
jgi:hypothetical protein